MRLMKHQSENIPFSEKVANVFLNNLRIKIVSFVMAITLVYLKYVEIIGHG